MAKLVVLSEGLTGKTYEIKVEKTTIGRLEDNSFSLSEPSVSSHHCEIFLRGNDLFVKDLSSTNGTFVNGEKVSEAPLKHGQILRLGQVEMRLEVTSPPPPGKIPMAQTRPLQGVKLNELEQGAKPVFEKGSPFAKKSNKTVVVFISIVIILVVVILMLLFYAMQNIGSK